MRRITSTLVGIGATITLCCVLGAAVCAQDRGMIAICPVVFDKGAGAPDSHAESIRALRVTLEHAGLTVADYRTMKTKWNDLGLAMPAEGKPPTSRDISRFGKAVGAKYVLAPEFDFSANQNWNVDKVTTVRASMIVFMASDGSRVFKQSETISKSPKSSGDFGTLSQAGREQVVVDQAIDVSLARFLRRVKPVQK